MRQSRKIFYNNGSVYFYIFIIFEFLWIQRVWTSEWHYGEDGSDDEWSGLCKTGRYQSPINLAPLTSALGKIGSIQFHGYNNEYDASITNNGHSLAVHLKNGNTNLQMEGAGLPGTYKLDHMHFHWKSEHTVSRRRYALECHFVHKNTAYASIKEAIKHKDGIAVIATLFHVSLHDNPSLNTILDQITDVNTVPGSKQDLKKPITPSNFLPSDITGFYRYYGSLTTPTCDESVVWTVFTESLPISEDQFNRFRSLRSNEGELIANNRPTKPINGRLVIYQESIFNETAKRMIMSDKRNDGHRGESMGQIFLTSLIGLFAMFVNFIHLIFFV